MNLKVENACRRLQVLCLGLGKIGAGWVDKHGEFGRRRHRLLQKLQPFFPASNVSAVVPVMLPPGRFKLATSPSATGSPAMKNTIGIDVVAALSANAEGVVDDTNTA